MVFLAHPVTPQESASESRISFRAFKLVHDFAGGSQDGKNGIIVPAGQDNHDLSLTKRPLGFTQAVKIGDHPCW